MTTHKEIQFEKIPDGSIQFLIMTVYTKPDGSELTRENMRVTYTPNDLSEVEKVFDEYYVNVCKAIWTQEVIEDYNKKYRDTF